jgi:two-component system, NtrC family, response regulator AtoC
MGGISVLSSWGYSTAPGMTRSTLLIVEDEPAIRRSLRAALEGASYTVLEAEDGARALALVSDEIDLVLLDYRLPDTDGLSLLKLMKERFPDLLVIMLTAFSSVEKAVEAMKQGAYHYANKPIGVDEILLLVEKALETTRLRRDVRTLLASQSEPYALSRIVGRSPAMTEVKELLVKIASSPASTVLLLGESGTGKDLAAKAIHFNSARAARPFMNITCSALPEQLLESELFGHERGAFTDAKQRKKGLIELADGGTVFLDEFSEMGLGSQAKLLRFLEEKAFKRVGGAVDIRVDVRVIAASNRHLEEAVAQGVLRKDLYYRLLVLPVRLPPLCERVSDIQILCDYFIDLFNREFHKKVKGLGPDALAVLESRRWEGNIRELKNVLERAMLLAEQETLEASDFALVPGGGQVRDDFALPASGVHLDELERNLVVQALERSRGNRTHAARLLGITRDRLRYRLEKFGLK